MMVDLVAWKHISKTASSKIKKYIKNFGKPGSAYVKQLAHTGQVRKTFELDEFRKYYAKRTSENYPEIAGKVFAFGAGKIFSGNFKNYTGTNWQKSTDQRDAYKSLLSERFKSVADKAIGKMLAEADIFTCWQNGTLSDKLREISHVAFMLYQRFPWKPKTLMRDKKLSMSLLKI